MSCNLSWRGKINRNYGFLVLFVVVKSPLNEWSLSFDLRCGTKADEMFTSLGRKVLKCSAPFSSAFDCTTHTAPNSPVPSAGKGRYYTPQMHDDTQATLISLISRCHPFRLAPGTTLSLHSGLLPVCRFSPGGAGPR